MGSYRLWCSVVCLVALTVGALAWNVAPGSSQVAGAATPDVLRIGYQVIPNTEAVVKGMGWLEQRLGTRVEWRQFESGRDVNTAMAAGGIDIGLVGSAPAAAGIAQGLPYEVIWIYDIIGDNEALVVRRGRNIRAARDLVGRKVAVPFGSTTHYHLLKYLELERVDARRVEIIDMQPPDMLAAWLRGDIHAGWVWHPTLQKMLDAGGEVLYSSRRMAERGFPTGDLGVVRKDFGRRYPKAVARYLAIQHEAVLLFRRNTTEAVKAVAKEFRISEAEARRIMSELVWLDGREQLSERYLGTPGRPGRLADVLKSTAEFLKGQGIIRSVPEVAVFRRAINASYLKEAMK